MGGRQQRCRRRKRRSQQAAGIRDLYNLGGREPIDWEGTEMESDFEPVSRGRRFALGRGLAGFVIWDMQASGRPVVEQFGPDAYEVAAARFAQLEGSAAQSAGTYPGAAGGSGGDSAPPPGWPPYPPPGGGPFPPAGPGAGPVPPVAAYPPPVGAARFCPACGVGLLATAVICPRCGTATGSPRSKGVAVLLAVFLSFWTWVYTYQRDKAKFWTGLVLAVVGAVLTVVAVGWLVLFGVWLWAIIATATRPEREYALYPNTNT